MTKLICWNIARRHAAWRSLRETSADIALLQEAGKPPSELAPQVEVDPQPFYNSNGKALSRTAIVKLSNKIKVEWLKPVPLANAGYGDFGVSHPGCISAAIVSPMTSEPFTVV